MSITPMTRPAEVPQDDDRELARRARDGDTKAFERLYRRYSGRVHSVCLRLAGNAALAEDCTQDAFVRAWESLAGFRGESSFGTWLHRIAVNTVLERHRTQLRQGTWFTLKDEDAVNAVASPEPGPELGMDLEEAIAGLPPAARMVFVLFDVEGHSHEEIAELTGLAVGTCKAHVHRARQLLRARLGT